MSSLRTAPITEIHPPLYMARQSPDEELEDLAQSIREMGILEPLLVRPKADHLELVAGARRLEAAKRAGLTEVPVVVMPLSDEEAMETQFIENIQRRDLTDYEKACWLREMKSRFSYTQQDLAKKVGKSESWVSLHLQMLQLDEPEFTRVNPNELTEFQARTILATPEERRPELLEKLANGTIPSGHRIQQMSKVDPVKLREYLVDLTGRYPAVTVGDEWQVDKMARTLGMSYSEARTELQNYQYQRIQSRSSGLGKAEPYEAKTESKVNEPEGKWQRFLNRPTPEISEMDQLVQNAMYGKGYFFEIQKEIPVRTTIPDLYFDGNPPISVYLDGPVHKNRIDRDQELRDLLAKRGVKVLSISYESPTKEAVAEAVAKIMEVLQ